MTWSSTESERALPEVTELSPYGLGKRRNLDISLFGHK